MPEETPRLPFEIDETVDPSLVTGRAGVPLVIELFRQLGAAATIHVQRRQGMLFADGSTVQHFAVVTNREGDGLALLQWHREKAGTVEHTHHVLKNELAAAALPSGKFGANATWFRLNVLTVLTYNLLTALKRLTLPGDLRTARSKRLRFLLFNTVEKVVAHTRRTLFRLTGAVQHALLVRVRSHIRALAPA